MPRNRSHAVDGNRKAVHHASRGDGRNPDPRLEAAQRRLRESASRADTFEAIREIVTNLLGCEEMGLFRAEAGNRGLLWSFGIDPVRHGNLDAFEESALERVLRHGECHVVSNAEEGGDGDAGQPPRVFIPIRLAGRTVGVLVMLKLLPQKLAFDDADMQLAKMLSDEAGRALFENSASAKA